MFKLLFGHLFKVSLACEVIFLASLYCFTFFVAVSLKLVICLVILYLLTTFVTVSCWKHFNCYHYIIIFVLMAIYHICISWTAFYELLPIICNISLVLVDSLFTSGCLSSCFCRLLYWETATDLEGFIYSILFLEWSTLFHISDHPSAYLSFQIFSFPFLSVLLIFLLI